jgi:Phage tail sheath C-terminal domain/Phage tail sheath protein subtilisin-like domain
MPEIILPGTYITVRDEGLITAGRVVTGNIGIVGTADKGPIDEVKILGSFTEAKEIFGDADAWQGGGDNELTLIRALEHVFNNGGRTVYAVRTAAGTPEKAAFQTRSDANAALALLKAKTPGKWAHQITVKIGDADTPALVQEKLAGNAATLNRSKVDQNSRLNSLTLKRNVTGATANYEIIYVGPVDNAKPQVLINPATGALTFTTLASHAPAALDSLIARYEVPTNQCRKVELFYKELREAYTVADASHLAEQINRRSTLVYTEASAETAHYNALPAKTTDARPAFGNGQNGSTSGSNGEAATPVNYRDSLAKLENEIVNIVVLPFNHKNDGEKGQIAAALQGHINITTEIKRERIAVFGSNGTDDVNAIANHNVDSDRIIFAGPGIRVSNSETLPGVYTAAAVAGLLSSLPVQTSPTNKTLAIPGLAAEFSSSKLEKLVLSNVLAVEKRSGYRIVKGITTASNTAWHQITTRRIVDYAIYGVRSACNPYIGKLNNDRVRGAMKATLDAFLTRMVEDEALTGYELEVSATRAQEIAGECIVTMTIRPTFSIDFVRVTMYLG